MDCDALLFSSCYERERDKNKFTFVCVVHSNLLVFCLSLTILEKKKRRGSKSIGNAELLNKSSGTEVSKKLDDEKNIPKYYEGHHNTTH